MITLLICVCYDEKETQKRIFLIITKLTHVQKNIKCKMYLLKLFHAHISAIKKTE